MKIKHAFISGVADGGDATLVRPSNWNADHTIVEGVVSVRQTVLTGPVDANGYPAFLAIGSGLAVDIVETSALRIAFAAGFDASGALDYIGSMSYGMWTSLTANSTLFLYINRDPSTGVLALGSSVLAPQYAYAAPGSPATDQHWFDLATFTMKRWTGSAWEAHQRVFVGECTTNASDVTSVTSYAMRGIYDSGWFDVSGTYTTYNKNSSIGVDAELQRVQLLYRESSSYVPLRVSYLEGYGDTAGHEFGAFVSVVSPVTTRILTSGTYVNPRHSYEFGAGGAPHVESGQYRILVERGF